jgi:hypothetical protein
MAEEVRVDPVRNVATICIGRAVGFGALAIAMLMLAFASDFALSLRFGAIGTLLMAGILTQKANLAPQKPPRLTEVWLCLDERLRPGDPNAQRAFTDTLRDVYGQFAKLSLVIACGLFALSVTVSIAGPPSIVVS